MEMRAMFSVAHSLEFMPLRHGALSIKSNQLSFPTKVFFSRAKFADSDVDESFGTKMVPPSLLAAEKEEAKAVLTLFMKKRGLSKAVAARTINKSELFIEHLISRLHSVHKSRYLVGRELTTLEIRDALFPYLESLLGNSGSLLVDLVESFPELPDKEKSGTPASVLVNPPPASELVNPPLASAPAPAPVKEKSIAPRSSPGPILDSKKLKAVTRVSEIGPAGKLPPHILYLIEIGMELDQIKIITRKFPAFAYYSLEGKIRPAVEFLLDLGVPKSNIPTILCKRPQLCGISLSENMIPTMTFLEGLGVDKTQWAKVIYRFPALLTYSRQKVKTTVDFLTEMGISEQNIGKILTRCPNIISYSVEDKLRPTAEYFCSLGGVDISVLLYRCPQAFGLSIECNLKPVTEFFMEKGYSIEEIGTMVSRYGALYTFSLAENLRPKWEFFLTMDYPNSELVKFPQYFGYSLEERIKPRYAVVKESGAKLLLNQVLSLSQPDFDKALKKKIEKMRSNGALK